MLAQAGQHPYFDFVPSCLPGRLATRRAKRDHHPIGAYYQGGGSKLGRQRLRRRQVALRQCMQVLLEGLHRLFTRCLYPAPHCLWADRAPTVPTQQASCSRKRHKNCQGTAQRLEFPTAPLMRLYAEQLAAVAVGILDFYHAVQYLWQGAAAWLDGRTPRARRWFGWARHRLRHGQPDGVLADLVEALAVEGLPDSARDTLTAL